MSARATLTITPVAELGPSGRYVLLDCPHGTTRVVSANAERGVQLEEADLIRAALARHFGEERCGCIAKLWPQYFAGYGLGEIPLAVGAP